MTTRQLLPTPIDGYATPTSDLQIATENILKSHILSDETDDESSITTKSKPQGPVLQKTNHFQFLLRNLRQGFPVRYVSQDASQPWLLYWTLQSFSALGVGLDDQTKRRATETLLSFQHPDGGFGGGPKQSAHLLPTYAAVCALAIVGRPGEGGGWDQIDRKEMHEFFLSLKQPDGSFLVSHDGEVDVRGLYCLLTTATLLNILSPALLTGVPEFIASCQTYEGGFGNTSFPGWTFPNGRSSKDPTPPRPPLGEAHGGYTFCATAAWILIQPYLKLYYSPSSVPARPSTPSRASRTSSLPNTPLSPEDSSLTPTPSSLLPSAPRIDLHALLRWTTQMQGGAAELGGFRGRTNKLVDGCYSWWVGACVGLVEGLLGIGNSTDDSNSDTEEPGEWDDLDESLFDRSALQEYILCAGQHPAGGLRDKPPKSADSYHTLYCLSGLSAAQHRVNSSLSRRVEIEMFWKDDGINEIWIQGQDSSRSDALRKEAFVQALSWLEDESSAKYIGGSNNRLNATHPLFDLTVTHTEALMSHFYAQILPHRNGTTPAPKRETKEKA